MDLLVTSSCHRHQLLLMVPWLPASSPTTCYKGRSFRHKGILTFFHTAVSVWESSKTYHKFTNLLYSVWQLMAVTVLNVLGKVTVISWSPLKPFSSVKKQWECPPSHIPKTSFQKLKKYPSSESEIIEVAKQVLLRQYDVQMWYEHLHAVALNQPRGAAKLLRLDDEVKKTLFCYCGVC